MQDFGERIFSKKGKFLENIKKTHTVVVCLITYFVHKGVWQSFEYMWNQKRFHKESKFSKDECLHLRMKPESH